MAKSLLIWITSNDFSIDCRTYRQLCYYELEERQWERRERERERKKEKRAIEREGEQEIVWDNSSTQREQVRCSHAGVANWCFIQRAHCTRIIVIYSSYECNDCQLDFLIFFFYMNLWRKKMESTQKPKEKEEGRNKNCCSSIVRCLDMRTRVSSKK